MKLEGGFQGRTNKLVDGCYSFWQGGAFPLLYSLLARCKDTLSLRNKQISCSLLLISNLFNL